VRGYNQVTVNRLLRAMGLEGAPPKRMLDGFVDSLLQTFENCRPGLAEKTIVAGGAEAFFVDLYEKEVPRLREQIRRSEAHLTEAERDELFRRVDERVRKVVLPGYSRLTSAFTTRERNDFYLAPEAFHGAERLGWGVAGLLLGGFVVAAPFIPLWSKEWVFVFATGGLLFPNLRRVFALRRYQGELNQLVTRTDDEIWRMDLALITAAAARDSGDQTAVPAVTDVDSTSLAARLQDPASSEANAARREKTRQGGV
jgi:hypothetical protein